MAVNPFENAEKPLHERLREAADTLELAYGQQRVVVDPSDLRERACEEEANVKKAERVDELAALIRESFNETALVRHQHKRISAIPFQKLPEQMKERYRHAARRILASHDVRRKEDLW